MVATVEAVLDRLVNAEHRQAPVHGCLHQRWRMVSLKGDTLQREYGTREPDFLPKRRYTDDNAVASYVQYVHSLSRQARV